MKRSVFLFIAVMFGIMTANRADAQLKVFYSFNRIFPKIGVEYDLNKIFAVDVSIYDVTTFDFFSPELAGRAKFLQKENYNLYTGAGVCLFFEAWSLTVPVGIEVRPFNAYPKLSFKFEFNALFNLDILEHIYMPGFAVCYRLGK
ncbi:MAG: hypothetical protein LBG92_01965 [Prevotellaceae bacterium]|jgi:hypothetical protein|nr:hypothetical protein [Prevotellaceae bacterium]